MSTMSPRRTLTALTVGALLAVPAAAGADAASAEGGTGTGTAKLVRNYELNAVSGRYAPSRAATASTAAAIHAENDSAPDPGFSWSDAATGAGFALLLAAGLTLAARTASGRRRSPAHLG
jgi:hypothetical protein